MKRSMFMQRHGLGSIYPDPVLLNFSNCGLASCNISGIVVDEQGVPLPGASVYPTNNRTAGTATDFDGNFSLTQPSGTLTISYMGFETKVINALISNRIVLKAATNVLDEFVGYAPKINNVVDYQSPSNMKIAGLGLLAFLLLFGVLKSKSKPVKAAL